MDRKEKHLDGCLLQSNTQFPQRDVIVCGKCPNRSDMVGDLSEFCHNTPDGE